MKWLELAIQAKISVNENQILLVNYTSPSYEFKTRVAAFEALKRLNICDITIVNTGFEALSSFNTRLSGPVKTVLEYFSQQNLYKKMMIECYRKCSDSKLKVLVKKSFTFLN